MINYFIFVKYNDGLDLIPGKCKHYLMKQHPHLSMNIRYFSLVTCSNILAKMLEAEYFVTDTTLIIEFEEANSSYEP